MGLSGHGRTWGAAGAGGGGGGRRVLRPRASCHSQVAFRHAGGGGAPRPCGATSGPSSSPTPPRQGVLPGASRLAPGRARVFDAGNDVTKIQDLFRGGGCVL